MDIYHFLKCKVKELSLHKAAKAEEENDWSNISSVMYTARVQ
jgi:hypothetical protein